MQTVREDSADLDWLPAIRRSSTDAQKIAYVNGVDLSHVDKSPLFVCAWCNTLALKDRGRCIDPRKVCDVCMYYHQMHQKRRPPTMVALERAKQLITLAAGTPGQSAPPAPLVSTNNIAPPATAGESMEIDSEVVSDDVSVPPMRDSTAYTTTLWQSQPAPGEKVACP